MVTINLSKPSSFFTYLQA